ncbi:MAG: D-glycero-alpha-D-manno-heptose-1,7-bisphosphate 7-phosphatase, partial [Gemmatimonadota bacterium]
MYDAAFIDRDGTLIEDPGYLSDPSGIVLLPGAAEAIRALNEAGIQAIMITNQSGIGRGYYSEMDFQMVQAELDRRLAEHGARLDGIYFCPHDPDTTDCSCRKPGAGLFRLAAREHGIRLHRSHHLTPVLQIATCMSAPHTATAHNACPIGHLKLLF